MLSSNHETLSYDISSDGTKLTAYVDSGSVTGSLDGSDRVIFDLAITDPESGSYTFTLKDQLDHSADGNTEGLLDLDLSGVIVRYDEDGDSATAGSGSLLITVQDDVPADGTGTERGYVEEEALSGGNQDTNDISGINDDGDGNNAVWKGSL